MDAKLINILTISFVLAWAVGFFGFGLHGLYNLMLIVALLLQITRVILSRK